jgi:hypothetical protein
VDSISLKYFQTASNLLRSESGFVFFVVTFVFGLVDRVGVADRYFWSNLSTVNSFHGSSAHLASTDSSSERAGLEGLRNGFTELHILVYCGQPE